EEFDTSLIGNTAFVRDDNNNKVYVLSGSTFFSVDIDKLVIEKRLQETNANINNLSTMVTLHLLNDNEIILIGKNLSQILGLLW
ncbi:12057_t:CDS:2, partial [Entrophospora sp. SA101]